MATVYKSTTYKTINNRTITAAPSSEDASISTILNSFITYFKTQHL